MYEELQITAITTAFFSTIYIIVSIINKFKISGEIQCFGIVFSIRRVDGGDTDGNTTNNNHISVGNAENNNDLTQEVEIEITHESPV